MATNKADQQAYRLAHGVRVFWVDGEEIRLRKGIWNHTEAVIRLHNETHSTKAFFARLVRQLANGGLAVIDDLRQELGITPKEAASFHSVLEDVRAQGFLTDATHTSALETVSMLLGGSITGYENHVSPLRPVMFICDTDYAREAGKTIAGQMSLPMDVIDATIYSELADADLTSKTDAIDHLRVVEGLKRYFKNYSCVVGSFSQPRVALLRNLNRVLVSLEKPLVLGFTDGPFLCVCSTVPPHTGCFECFEQRVLARLEDNVAYHQFVEAQKCSTHAAINDAAAVPSIHILTSAVLAEGFLMSALGMCRFAGRCLNAYLPVLEIHVEDLLRVPYCPACGSVATMEMHEMYASSKQIMDKMLRSIDIK